MLEYWGNFPMVAIGKGTPSIPDEVGTELPLGHSTPHSDPNIVGPMPRLPVDSISANQLCQVPGSSKNDPLTPEHEIQSIRASQLVRLPQLLPSAFYGAIGSITVDKSGTLTTIRQTSRHYLAQYS